MSVYELIKSDLYRCCGSHSHILLIKNLLNSNRSFKYTFWLRMLHARPILIRWLAKYMHRHLSIKYNIQIPKEVEIGPGLYLGHGTSIIVNATAKIGKNCNLSQFVTIGSNHGKAATIGDNCYIGPSACLVEDISIGGFSVIGAGAVVIKDVPAKATAVGNPARNLTNKEPRNYILNPVNDVG